MPKTVLCLKVPKKQGEKAITLAGRMRLIDRTLGIGREGEYLLIPILREPKKTEWTTIAQEIPEIQSTEGSFVEKKPPMQTLEQVLQNQLPPNLLVMLPQAFDIVGDIIIIDIPPLLKSYQGLIGAALLQTHRSIKTVLAKASDISGDYRIRDYTHIVGENKTNAIHREFGCIYHVDLARAYFSPRLSHEHERVVSLVQSGEVVVDLFAGVGPFSVLIGKRCPGARVYAVDLNPDAVELLKANLCVNRVDDRVFAVCADARKLSKGKLKGVADRVIMNLPETALDFVDAACSAIKPSGGVVHFYSFVRLPDTVESLKRRFSEAVTLNGRKVETFFCSRCIRETAPFESQVVLDAEIR